MGALRQPTRRPLWRAVACLLVLTLTLGTLPLEAGLAGPAAASKLTKSAFGEVLEHSGTDPQPYSFAGEPYDPNMGFQYHRARWYVPGQGRFVGMDRFRGRVFDPPSLHRYLYAALNPANLVDPSGRNWDLPSITTVVAITTTLGAIGGYVSGGPSGAIQGAATGFLIGALIYELAALAIGTALIAAPTITLWPKSGAPPFVVLPRSAPITVTLPQGPANTITMPPPIPTSLRLSEASTRTRDLAQRLNSQVQSAALGQQARRALANHNKIADRLLNQRGGSYQNAPDGTPPKTLAEATANFRQFWAEVDGQLTATEKTLIDDLLDGSFQ